MVARGPGPATVTASAVVVNAHPTGPGHDYGGPVAPVVVIGVSGRIPWRLGIAKALPMRPGLTVPVMSSLTLFL